MRTTLRMLQVTGLILLLFGCVRDASALTKVSTGMGYAEWCYGTPGYNFPHCPGGYADTGHTDNWTAGELTGNDYALVDSLTDTNWSSYGYGINTLTAYINITMNLTDQWNVKAVNISFVNGKWGVLTPWYIDIYCDNERVGPMDNINFTDSSGELQELFFIYFDDVCQFISMQTNLSVPPAFSYEVIMDEFSVYGDVIVASSSSSSTSSSSSSSSTTSSEDSSTSSSSSSAASTTSSSAESSSSSSSFWASTTSSSSSSSSSSALTSSYISTLISSYYSSSSSEPSSSSSAASSSTSSSSSAYSTTSSSQIASSSSSSSSSSEVSTTTLPFGWITTTTSTTSSTLCVMQLKQGQPGLVSCIGDYCSDALCVAGDQDYFVSFKYQPYDFLAKIDYNILLWFGLFVFTLILLFMVLGFIVSGVLYAVLRLWKWN